MSGGIAYPVHPPAPKYAKGAYIAVGGRDLEGFGHHTRRKPSRSASGCRWSGCSQADSTQTGQTPAENFLCVVVNRTAAEWGDTVFERWRNRRRADGRRRAVAAEGGQWQEWLRRSPVGRDLVARWREAGDFRRRLGDEAYRRQLVELLSGADPRDCAAAGFGCTRRVDRACRGPEICSREPGGGLAGVGRREGPVPGACDAFYGYHGDDLRIQVSFAARERHRAVFWADSRGPVRLWVDGVPVGTEHLLATPGYWVGDRFFVVDVPGPEDHPAQRYVLSDLVTTIVSLLIYDADRAAAQLLVPQPGELWTDPRVERHGDVLHVYPDPAARAAGRPDRTLPAT
jgi:hypothetical protein